MDDNYAKKFKATARFDEIVWHFRSNLPLHTNRKDLMNTVENSFTGKEAVDFLLAELPRIVPDKVPTRPNIEKFIEMFVEFKVIAEAFPKKGQTKRPYSDSRLYVFAKSLAELKKPKPKSRRSASFNGTRKTSKTPLPSSPSTSALQRSLKSTRRLSVSNGNVLKAEGDPKISSQDGENKSFVKVRVEPKTPRQAPKILNRSLESICPVDPPMSAKKEKVYDWLPFFKSKRFASKNPPRRSASLDRNHCIVQQENKEKSHQRSDTTPPPPYVSNDVFMNPKGPLLSAPPSRYQNHRYSIVQSNPMPLTRGRMYESIMRRPSIPTYLDSSPQFQENQVWKNELLTRLATLYDHPLPPDYSAKIDGHDVKWNTQELDEVDGIVKARSVGAQADYPTSIIQFMDYLGKYPFSVSKKNEMVYEHSVPRIFSTLVNRLEDLNSPLHTDECSLIVSILSKVDAFSQMLETGAARRWSRVMAPTNSASSIDEPAGLMTDGFSRDFCTIRASKHRRRALSPYDNRIRLDIQDEKTYKIREDWLIESLQLILLALPTARRRKLHKFVLFMKSVATNEVFDIADPSNGSSNNREAAIIGLWTGVCGGFRKLPGMLITAVLLANYRTLFSVPDDFVERVQNLDQQESVRYDKVTRGRRARKVAPEAKPVPVIAPQPLVVEKPTKRNLFTRLLGK